MKILFDTDIGSDIDDALALLLLLEIPRVELVGVTTVYGCTDIRAKVAKKILDAAGHPAPVIAGCCVPFESPLPVWHAGTEGKGILSDEEFAAPLAAMGIATGAEEFIIDEVERHGGNLTILCLGALTNLAAALRRQPSLKSRLGTVFFMGGGVTFRQPPPPVLEPGGWYMAEASHNVRCDVRAAQEVFCSGIPMTILTNDVTTRVWWDGPSVQRLIAATAPPEAIAVGRLLDVWLKYRSSIFGRRITGTCPHDPLTVAEATGSRYVSYARGTMEVNPDATTLFTDDEQGPHRAGLGIDAQSFLDWFSHRMSTAESNLIRKGADE